MLIMKYFPKIGKHSPVKDIPVRNHNNDNQALNFFKDVKEPDPDVWKQTKASYQNFHSV